jgi:methionyl-tRNA synthetase
MSSKHTITAALPYANGPLHLGHISGVYLPADIYSRFLRSKGEDTLFVCGSDEHGAAITLRAKKEGTTPQEIINKYHELNKKAFENFSISFDIYDRTSSELHHKTAQDYFKKLNDEGKFITKSSEQYFDEEHQQFLADRYITGTCPKCNHDGAYGDQCEKCGSTLSPTELINPKSTLSGSKPILKETFHWYLPMDQHETWLKEWITEGTLDGKKLHEPKAWRNQVKGQVMSWIDGGLAPRAMTRDLDWGVPVPVENGEGKVLYVWLDAPIGYISATKKWAAENNKNWEDYWKNDAELIHFIGKDNIVFHAIIFPILLKEHGGFVLPKNVPASEFLNLEGDKFSTSRNWAVWLHEYLESYPNKVDELRYVLTAIAPENKDAEFTWAEYQKRINNELVADLGNFVNRALVLTNKFFEGVVPEAIDLLEEDKLVLNQITPIVDKLEESIRAYRFKEAQNELMNIARLGNKYFGDTEPWKLKKTDPVRMGTILNVGLQITANIAIAMDIFMPNKSKELKQMLNLDINLSNVGTQIVDAGHKLNSVSLLFEKIEDPMVEKEVEKLNATKTVDAKFEPQKDEVGFEDFMNMDIRVGEIVEAVKVPKAKKLLQLTINTGIDTRTVVSGIAEHYKPEDIVGKKVSVLLNLAPRKIRGVESQGMVLMAENPEGKLVFVEPSEKDFTTGSGIR